MNQWSQKSKCKLSYQACNNVHSTSEQRHYKSRRNMSKEFRPFPSWRPNDIHGSLFSVSSTGSLHNCGDRISGNTDDIFSQKPYFLIQQLLESYFLSPGPNLLPSVDHSRHHLLKESGPGFCFGLGIPPNHPFV